MPYKTNDDLPEAVRSVLPAKAQTIFRSAHNVAKDGDEPGSATAAAWSAVKKTFKKNEDGEWVEKIRYIAKDEKSHYTLGVVYEPDEFDTDEEFTDAAELEKACWDFMRELQGRRGLSKAGLDILAKVKEATESGAEVKLEVDDVLKEIEKRGVNAMHIEDLDDCEVVECYIAPADMKIGKQTVKKGSWLAGIVWSPEMYKKIEKGEWTGYSMGGSAHKVAV